MEPRLRLRRFRLERGTNPGQISKPVFNPSVIGAPLQTTNIADDNNEAASAFN